MRNGKDTLGHNWQGHACINCKINAWTEASMWPCSASEEDDAPRRKLTREERLQELADQGIDTWEEYRGER